MQYLIQENNMLQTYALDKENPILVGMPGSGKSTIWKPLAARLWYQFHDSDDDIKEKTWKDVSDWLEYFWDDAFLAFEAVRVQQYYVDLVDTVLSTWWSVVLMDSSVRFLKKRGKLILLDTPIEEILKRAEGMRIDRIVGLNGENPRFKTLKELFEYRKKIYLEAQDITIQTFWKETEQVVEEIIRALS